MDPLNTNRIMLSGLSTGMDTRALIEALMTAERRPLNLLQARKSTVEDERKLFQEFNSLLLQLRSASQAIDNQNSVNSATSVSEEFLTFAATSSDESILTATATGNATPGEYEITVNQLATIGREFSGAFTSDSTAIATAGQTMTIDYGGTTDITLTFTGGESLQAIRTAINNDSDNDGNVRAEIVYEGGAGGYRLIISGTQTGEDNDITVTTNLSGPSGSPPFIDATKEIVAGNSEIEVLGLTIERDSNTITDAIPGVTLNLLGEHGAGESLTLNIETDLEGIKTSLQNFADAYNAVVGFVRKQSQFDEATKRAGLLSGNPTLRGVQLQIQMILTDEYTFANNDFTSIGQIGLEFQSDGTLKINADVLEEALNKNAQDVREFFGFFDEDPESDNGLASSLAVALAPLTRSGDGTLAVISQTLQDNVKDLEGQIDRLERRLEQREETLIRQFTAMESAVAALQSQLSFLASMNR